MTQLHAGSGAMDGRSRGVLEATLEPGLGPVSLSAGPMQSVPRASKAVVCDS